MSKNWILVSNSNRARIFAIDSATKSLIEIEDLAHPEARLHTREITSDLPGKYHGGGPSGHHAVEAKSDAHKFAREEFAREIASYLHSNLDKDRYDSLVLVCEPAFLGELRQELDERVKERVTLEVTKNLVKQPVDVIRAHLPQFLPGQGF